MMKKKSVRMLTAVVCLLLCLMPLAEAAYGTLRRFGQTTDGPGAYKMYGTRK